MNNSTTFDQVRASAKAAGLTIAHAETDPGFYIIPSATDLNKTYTVFLSASGPLCSCPARGRCWHGARALELAAQAAQAPARPKVAYAQAMDDLFGRKVA